MWCNSIAHLAPWHNDHRFVKDLEEENLQGAEDNEGDADADAALSAAAAAPGVLAELGWERQLLDVIAAAGGARPFSPKKLRYACVPKWIFAPAVPLPQCTHASQTMLACMEARSCSARFDTSWQQP